MKLQIANFWKCQTISLRWSSVFSCECFFLGTGYPSLPPSQSPSSALEEQHCSYLYLYLWDYRCWQVKNGTLPVCSPLHHLSFCQWSSKKANGFPASSWKMHYSDWWITAAPWSRFSFNIFSPSRKTQANIQPFFFYLILKTLKCLDVWDINLCMCLTRKWICTEPISKTSLAWRSVTGLMMRMRLGSTLVRYVMQGSSQINFSSKYIKRSCYKR